MPPFPNRGLAARGSWPLKGCSQKKKGSFLVRFWLVMITHGVWSVSFPDDLYLWEDWLLGGLGPIQRLLSLPGVMPPKGCSHSVWEDWLLGGPLKGCSPLWSILFPMKERSHPHKRPPNTISWCHQPVYGLSSPGGNLCCTGSVEGSNEASGIPVSQGMAVKGAGQRKTSSPNILRGCRKSICLGQTIMHGCGPKRWRFKGMIPSIGVCNTGPWIKVYVIMTYPCML